MAMILFVQDNTSALIEYSLYKNINDGFECSGGESNQPRPEVKLRLGDVTRKALELPQPKYPQRAKAARISGKVKAEIVIDVHSGKVVWARVLSGHPLLQEAVSNVVCQARFAPTSINSPPVRVSGFIIYKFGRS
ncbi:MAG: energy transducer TonB [Pyrinomonadaceae bacterium]|jgi:TonB family protein|nr:energy transducer TonB [Pyrinomonadaceae bacterium]